jgi:hypothetical protein|tara:strand:+ start:2544 stop:2699 length:156 start_codon:yes stop_codon:yes gene_type:complete
MKQVIQKLKELRDRVTRQENKAKRIVVGNRVFVTNSNGKLATNLKNKWQIN